MSPWLAFGVYLAVHGFGWSLLRSSGTWQVLFAADLRLDAAADPDPLAAAPRGWIENHTFWELEDEHGDADGDMAEAFWGVEQEADAG